MTPIIPKSSTKWISKVLCLLFLVGYLTTASLALAHGGGILQVANYPIGAYQVSVWTNPPTPRAGQTIHLTVGIANIDFGEPVLDAAVLVTVMAEGELLMTAPATTEQSVNRLFYEADLPSLPVGRYEVVVQVTGSEGSGELTFLLEVMPVSPWAWICGGVAAAGITGLALWYWRRRPTSDRVRRYTAVSRPARRSTNSRLGVDETLPDSVTFW